MDVKQIKQKYMLESIKHFPAHFGDSFELNSGNKKAIKMIMEASKITAYDTEHHKCRYECYEYNDPSDHESNHLLLQTNVCPHVDIFFKSASYCKKLIFTARLESLDCILLSAYSGYEFFSNIENRLYDSSDIESFSPERAVVPNKDGTLGFGYLLTNGNVVDKEICSIISTTITAFVLKTEIFEKRIYDFVSHLSDKEFKQYFE